MLFFIKDSNCFQRFLKSVIFLKSNDLGLKSIFFRENLFFWQPFFRDSVYYIVNKENDNVW